MMMTIDQALAAGFTVDHHAAGRPVAYKGPRFQPTQCFDVHTRLEAELIERVAQLEREVEALREQLSTYQPFA